MIQLARGSTTWQFEFQAPDGKTVASYNSHRGTEKRIEANEEEARDNALYDRICWTATLQDGSGWHGTVPLEDWRKLACAPSTMTRISSSTGAGSSWEKPPKTRRRSIPLITVLRS